MDNKQRCIDPELRRRLFTEIMHSGLNADAVVMPSELLDHARTCPACSSEFERWIEKADVGRILRSAREIIRRAAEGDLTVQRREGKGRRFYFGPRSGSSTGTIVTTDAEDHIIKADEGSVEDFLRIE